jgi:hypothetical protein
MDSNCIEVVAWVSLSTIPPLMLLSIIRPLLAVEVSKLLKPFDILAFNVLSILFTVLSPPDSTKYLQMNLITACKIHITRFNCQRAILFELWHQKHVQDKRYKHIELWEKKKKFYRQKRGSPSAAEIVSVFLPNNPQM